MTELRVRTASDRVTGLVRIVRPGAALAAATICLVGASMGSVGNWLTVMLAMVAVGSAVAASNVFNDVVDVEADRINVPDRPIPSGRVSPNVAIALSAALAALSMLATIPLGLDLLMIVVAVLVVSASYSLRLKRILVVGPAVVGLLLAAALFFGATLDPPVTSVVWIGSIEIALFTFGRETLKGVRDVEGDRRQGVATVANVWGARWAVVVFSASCGLVVATAALSGLLSHLAVMTLLVGLPGILIAIVWWRSERDRTHWAIVSTSWLWISGLLGIALL